MSPKQLFEVFSEEQQAEYEKEAMQNVRPRNGEGIQPEMEELHHRREAAHWRRRQRRLSRTCSLPCPKEPLRPKSQACVEALAQAHGVLLDPQRRAAARPGSSMYNDDPRFKANFDKVHPHLAEFVREAIKIYVQNKKK